VDASEFTQYRPLMFSIAYRMTGSVSDAEDIVQETFLRTVANPDKLRHLGPVSQIWHLRRDE
jgi:RNA polymerase sigma-70 factor, ECF subfamily